MAAVKICIWLCAIAVVLWADSLLGQTDKAQEIQRHYAKAQKALSANQPEVAADEFRQILRLDPYSAEAYANLGSIALKRSEYAEAERSFEVAVKLKPSLWNAQALLGLTRSRMGNTSGAIPLLEQSFEHLEDIQLRSEVGVELIQIYQQANTLDKAVDILRVLRRSSPDDPELLYATYRTYSDLAAQAVAVLIRKAPESARMHHIMAQACQSQGSVACAIAQYRKVLEINPHFPGIHYELGRAILESSQQETARQQAQSQFEAELQINPNDSNSEYELGEICSLRSDLKHAAQHYTHALEFRPDFVDAQIGLAKVLTAMGQLNEALLHLQKAILLEPENDVAHYRLAQVYRRLGSNQDANREQEAFRKLRQSQDLVRSYQQLEGKPITAQTVESPEPE